MAEPRKERVNHTSKMQPQSRRTYVRVVLRQHTPSNLQRLLIHHKSILVPPKIRVCVGEIAHYPAYNRVRQMTRQ